MSSYVEVDPERLFEMCTDVQNFIERYRDWSSNKLLNEVMDEIRKRRIGFIGGFWSGYFYFRFDDSEETIRQTAMKYFSSHIWNEYQWQKVAYDRDYRLAIQYGAACSALMGGEFNMTSGTVKITTKDLAILHSFRGEKAWELITKQ